MTVHVDRSLRLPESQFFPEPQAKSGIAIHHTVCRSAGDTVELWRKDKAPDGSDLHVATAFVIERDGIIYEAFDPAAWAYQFGLSWPDARRIPFEKRFIGIELASEGGLVELCGDLYAFDKISPLTIKARAEAFECITPYRGYSWFDRYEPDQLDALGRLVDDLCTRFRVPRVYPDKPFLYYGDALASFKGIIGHAMVRPDKSDPAPDPGLWKALERAAGLRPVAPSAPASAQPLNRSSADALFADNARQLNRMDTGAGSLVKSLLMELERRGTYLRLAEPKADDFTIGYDVVQGDRGQVAPLAKALGFKSVTDRVLEVADA